MCAFSNRVWSTKAHTHENMCWSVYSRRDRFKLAHLSLSLSVYLFTMIITLRKIASSLNLSLCIYFSCVRSRQLLIQLICCCCFFFCSCCLRTRPENRSDMKTKHHRKKKPMNKNVFACGQPQHRSSIDNLYCRNAFLEFLIGPFEWDMAQAEWSARLSLI